MVMGEEMKVSLKSIVYNLICIYPVLNIFVCYLSDGDTMLIFSALYTCQLLLGIMIYEKKCTKQTLLLVLYGFVNIGVTCARETGKAYIANAILFAVTLCSFQVFSDHYIDIKDFAEYVKKRRVICYVVQILFWMILLYHYSLYGLRYGWSTYVLQGPYNYPHTLAYLLLLLALLDIFLWNSENSGFGLVTAGINLALMLLTAVRVALLAACIAILFLLIRFMTTKSFRRFLIFLVIGTLALVLTYQYGIFTALFEKTQEAIGHSDISNGRGTIAITSLKALMDGEERNILHFLFGVGQQRLLSNNFKYLRSAVHAHNDFVNALVCYGIIGLGMYVYGFSRFARKNKTGIWLCVGCLAFGNGLFMYIDAIPMLLYARLFFEGVSYKEGSVAEITQKKRKRRNLKRRIMWEKHK